MNMKGYKRIRKGIKCKGAEMEFVMNDISTLDGEEFSCLNTIQWNRWTWHLGIQELYLVL